MRIGIILPTRGDRSEFLEHAKKMIAYQTKQPDHVEIIVGEPESEYPDITYRYKTGYERLKNKCDLIFAWEDDDWYSPDYLQTMINFWVQAGKPELIGLNSIIYYHIIKLRWKVIELKTFGAMCNTAIRSDIDIKWEQVKTNLDIHLYKNHSFNLIQWDIISLGIKHCIGMKGGAGHDKMNLPIKDKEMKYLKSIVDPVSFTFYKDLHDKHCN